ncbi:helix-turn-helix domain-containing protein [Streptomyces sp.]|uniref:helix-turn-helix domain-containing protein n=1 Tax=Streptomyces sp. TaxID=1931 RepID=UPI002F939B39
MSTEAVNWAMDHAPMLRTEKGKPDTTARHVLQALAEHARPDGSNAHPSVLRIQYRTGYDRTTVQRALRRLENGGLIRKDGTTENRTRWQLAVELVRPATDWKELEREEDEFRAAAAERKRRSRAKGVTHAEFVTVTDSKGVTVTDAESVTDGGHALKVRDVTDFKSVRHARNAALTTNQPPTEPNTDTSSPAALVPAGRSSKSEQHLEAFGAFWLIYPKKKAREEAKKAWIAAIERGADPARIVDAATVYAHERTGEDPQYTKYPATWLNKGCYDDEPDPQPRPQPGANGIPQQNDWTMEDFHSGFAS